MSHSRHKSATQELGSSLPAEEELGRVRVSTEVSDTPESWHRLASQSTNPRQERAFLRQVLRLEPRNRQAIERLRQLDAQLTSVATYHVSRSVPGAPTGHGSVPAMALPSVGPSLMLIALLIIVGGLALQMWLVKRAAAQPSSVEPALTPTPSPTPTITPTPTPSVGQRVAQQIPNLEDSWKARDWHTAAELLSQISVLDGDYPGLPAARCDTYTHWAEDLVQAGQVRAAYNAYRQASSYCRNSSAVEAEKALALAYLSGQWRHEHERWDEAAAALQKVYDANPDYADVRFLLHDTYLAQTKALVREGEILRARDTSQAALRIKPEDPEATGLLQEIQAKLMPTPTPAPANPLGKRIEVNISEQRLYVWQGDNQLYKWVISTGEPGRETAAGHFHILDKIPEAWASTWQLRMPYWMGVYWAGSLENGFHALPILPNGQTLWAGFLGTPVSYGCIILSTENARTLYNWAEVGTPVWIHY